MVDYFCHLLGLIPVSLHI